jgi:hypothetical protein
MRAIVATTLCVLSLVNPIRALAEERRTREFNGVTASFTLLNPRLRARDPLRVRFSLLNESNHPATFSFLGLAQHVDVYTRRGEQVLIKMNAPILEPVAEEIALKPGEKVERTEKMQLSIWYDFALGDYYLIFRYDLRLLPDDVAAVYKQNLHSKAWVNWDSKKYWFHIHR